MHIAFSFSKVKTLKLCNDAFLGKYQKESKLAFFFSFFLMKRLDFNMTDDISCNINMCENQLEFEFYVVTFLIFVIRSSMFS